MADFFYFVAAVTSFEVEIADEDIAKVDDVDVTWVIVCLGGGLNAAFFRVNKFCEGHLDLVIAVLSHERNVNWRGFPIFVIFGSDAVNNLLFGQVDWGKVKVGETSTFSDQVVGGCQVGWDLATWGIAAASAKTASKFVCEITFSSFTSSNVRVL